MTAINTGMTLATADLSADDIGVRCRQCGLVFRVAEARDHGCPECALLEALVRDDMAAPDRAAMTYGGPVPPLFHGD